jgi:ABC-type multidrug transport system permease subunit
MNTTDTFAVKVFWGIIALSLATIATLIFALTALRNTSTLANTGASFASQSVTIQSPEEFVSINPMEFTLPDIQEPSDVSSKNGNDQQPSLETMLEKT